MSRDEAGRAGTTNAALTDWDRSELIRLGGRAGALEPLRRALVETDRKVEQETIQRQLPDLFRVRRGPP